MTRLCHSARALALAVCLGATATAASSAEAQQTPTWRIEPAVGVLIDDYDVGNDGSRAGVHASLQVSRALGATVRGVASLGVARVGDVGAFPPASGITARNDWIFAMAGPQIDIPARRAAVSLAFQAGVAWRRIVVSGGTPPEGFESLSEEWSPVMVLAPSLQLRVPVASNLAVTGGASAYVLHPFESSRLSPAFTLGVAFQR